MSGLLRCVLGSMLLLGVPLGATADERMEVEVVSGSQVRVDVIEENDEIWLIDERVFEPGTRGVRVKIAQDAAPLDVTPGTATQGADQTDKRGVIASCELFYNDPASSCSRMPNSSIGASRQAGTRMQAGAFATTRLPQSQIDRGSSRVGAQQLPQSQLSTTRIAPSSERMWPEQRRQSTSHSPPWQSGYPLYSR